MSNNQTFQKDEFLDFRNDMNKQLTINLSPENIEKAKPRKQDYSNDWACHNAWMNRLAVNTIKQWLEDATGEEVKIWEEKTLHTFWEVVNGTALEINDKRIILIPRDDLDTEEFIVPTEWVKIPNWIGDYYLAIQVNLEDMWLRVWGCTTHKHICQMGEYDARWRNYCLGEEELISDIHVMLVARKFDAENKLAIDPLPVLSSAEINRMISDLAQPSSFSPRYKVDWDKWCVFIADKVRTTNLAEWLENVYQIEWQPSEKLVPTKFYRNIESRKNDRSQIINLGNTSIILRIILFQDKQKELKIIIRVCPNEKSGIRFIPDDLILKVIDDSNNIYSEQFAKNNIIENRVKVVSGEYFKLQLILKKLSKEVNLKFVLDE